MTKEFEQALIARLMAEVMDKTGCTEEIAKYIVAFLLKRIGEAK